LELLDAELRCWVEELELAFSPSRKNLCGRTELVATRMAAIIRVIPELGPDEAYQVVAQTLLIASASWPYSQPTEALAAAYAADPTLAETQSFTEVVHDTVEFTLTGLLARQCAESARPGHAK
jgi:hypothetical protein